MYGAAQCHQYGGGCQGSADGICRPYALWASTLRSTSNYEHAWLIDGILGTMGGKDTFITFPFGVRCVLDLKLYRRFAAVRQVGEFQVRCCTVLRTVWRLPGRNR